MDRMQAQKEMVERAVSSGQANIGPANLSPDTPKQEQIGVILQRIISKISETNDQAESVYGKLNGFEPAAEGKEGTLYTIQQMVGKIERDIDKLYNCIYTCNSQL